MSEDVETDVEPEDDGRVSVADLIGQQPAVEPDLPDPERYQRPAWESDYDSDRPICQEPGCGRPCRKVRNSDDFYDWCATHNKEHSGSATPASRQPGRLNASRKASAERIENNVVGWLAMLQTGLIANEDYYCAKAVGDEGPAIAKSLGDLSQDFPLLKRVLETGDKWGSLSILMFHSLRLGLTIGVHHQWVPYEGPVRFMVPAMQPPPPIVAQYPQQATPQATDQAPVYGPPIPERQPA